MMSSRVRASLQAILVGCSLLSLSAGAAIRQSQETAEQSVDRVKKAIQKEVWAGAKSGIGQAPALKPKSAEAQFIAAQVYWHEGARSMAMEALEKAIENQWVYPEAHLLLAQCLAEVHKPDKARDEAHIALAQGISGFLAYRLLGEIDIARGDIAAAVNSLETALRYSAIGDEAEAAKVREQLSGLRECAEKFEGFADLEQRQKAQDIVPPVLVNCVGPGYTEEARTLKIQGTVAMVLLIAESGDVESVLLYRRLGHGLDERAIEAARKLKFSPATQSGQPIRYLTRLDMEFNLR